MQLDKLIALLPAALALAFIITAIYSVFKQGMFFGWLRILGANGFDKLTLWLFKNKQPYGSADFRNAKRWSCYLQKPIWDCLTCMSSVWTILLTWSFDIKLILLVCGICAIIDKFLDDE